MEGRPPASGVPALIGFGSVTVVATALAFAARFAGLRHLSAGAVGLTGLLNPVTGVLLGTLVAGEAPGTRQIGGICLVFLGILLGRHRAQRRRSHLTDRPDGVPPESEERDLPVAPAVPAVHRPPLGLHVVAHHRTSPPRY
jgi:probable blue pigment (indigoidine) exporter